MLSPNKLAKNCILQEKPVLVTTFHAPTLAATNPWTAGRATKAPPRDAWHDPEVLSLHVLPDEHLLVAVTRAGDITTIALDDDTPVVCAYTLSPVHASFNGADLQSRPKS